MTENDSKPRGGRIDLVLFVDQNFDYMGGVTDKSRKVKQGQLGKVQLKRKDPILCIETLIGDPVFCMMNAVGKPVRSVVC